MAISKVPFRQSLSYAACVAVVNVLIVADVRGVPADAIAIAIAALFTFNVVIVVVVAFAVEKVARDRKASSMAVVAASSDAQSILCNLFPTTTVSSMKRGDDIPAEVHEGVAVLYADMAGFTRLSSTLPSAELMATLNAVYSRFDEIVEEASLWKVETVGDAYIVVGGIAASDVSETPRDRLEKVLRLAVRLLEEMALFRERFKLPMHLRVGVHSGSVITGIVGTQRVRFCK